MNNMGTKFCGLVAVGVLLGCLEVFILELSSMTCILAVRLFHYYELSPCCDAYIKAVVRLSL